MFYAEDSTIGAICRPGAIQPPRPKGTGTRPENRPDLDVSAMRLRLLESAIFEAASALSASADECFDALCRTIDRLAGKGGPGTPCQSCGTITDRGKFCSNPCKAHWQDCAPDERRNKRRKASGALI